LNVRLSGPIALELQAVFVEDWYAETGEALGDPRYFPEPRITGEVTAQTLPSGPGYPRENNQRLIVSLIHAAASRIVITMPYLVPDEALLQALQTAVLRGIDVTLVVPLQMDQILVHLAQRSYYDELLGSGVRICRYGKRFLHAKHVTIDDRIACRWIFLDDLVNPTLDVGESVESGDDPQILFDGQRKGHGNVCRGEIHLLKNFLPVGG